MATFGLIAMLVLGEPCGVTAGRIAAYILAAYWFTSSTSFANPAATLARAFTDTFSGIRPVDALWFAGAQLVGATAAVAFAELFARRRAS